MIEQAHINIFIDALARYFEHLDAQIGGKENKLEVGAPYLLKSDHALGQDYTGVISISGSRWGTVFVTTGGALLKRILLSYGESELGDPYKRDLIGEIANTLAGNARRQLGAEFHISTPTVMQGKLDSSRFKLSSRCFVLPFRWRSNKAELVVSISKEKP